MAEEKSAKKDIRPYVPPKECPKCGSRMANHADRYTCGKCGYTEFKSQAQEAQAEQKPQDAKKSQKPKQGKKDKAATV
ncbi:MAG: 30S ribosomal protein S27ae [Candidatus Micrarchaeaceae archaeon]|jgi:small subunit ribosomal protein S27Ae